MKRAAGHRARQGDQIQHFGLYNTVKDVQPTASISNDASFAQHCQLLRDVRLPHIQQRFEMADALLAVVQRLQMAIRDGCINALKMRASRVNIVSHVFTDGSICKILHRDKVTGRNIWL